MIILSENTSLFLEKHITENHKVFSFVGNRMHSLLQKHGLLGTSSPFIHYHRQWGYIIVETTAYDVYVSDTEVIPRRLAFLDDFLRTRDLAYNRVIFNDTSTRVVRMVVDDITLRVVYMDINGPQLLHARRLMSWCIHLPILGNINGRVVLLLLRHRCFYTR
jgi:hypothetical protein